MQPSNLSPPESSESNRNKSEGTAGSFIEAQYQAVAARAQRVGRGGGFMSDRHERTSRRNGKEPIVILEGGRMFVWAPCHQSGEMHAAILNVGDVCFRGISIRLRPVICS